MKIIGHPQGRHFQVEIGKRRYIVTKSQVAPQAKPTRSKAVRTGRTLGNGILGTAEVSGGPAVDRQIGFQAMTDHRRGSTSVTASPGDNSRRNEL